MTESQQGQVINIAKQKKSNISSWLNVSHESHVFCVENFAKSEYYRSAVEQLNNHSTAMANLGAPPLKIHNIHLTDRYNRVDHTIAQVSLFLHFVVLLLEVMP